jgi:glycosyltransferase involved in cell wall biosynthesis
MRVAIFTDTYLPEVNGVARTLGKWSRYLESQHIPCRIFAPTAPANHREEVSNHVERFFSIPFFLYPECQFALPNPLNMKRALQEFQPTIIHVATPFNLGLLGNHYARKLDIPVVASYHTHFDQYLHYYKLSWMEPTLWKYMTWFHANCRKVYVPSESTRQHLQHRGFPELEIWGRGIESEKFHPKVDRHTVLQHYGVDSRKFVILFVGRLAPEKSIDVLIKAFLAVPQHLREQMELVIAGDGPMHEELSEIAKEHRNIRLTGFLHGENLRELYAAADLFLFPSATETFGNVILESMASGTAVIGAAAGGVQDNIRHGETGWLCPPHDVPAFTAAISELYAHPQLRAQLASAGRAYALTQSWDRIFARLLSSYEQAIASPTTKLAQIAL